MSFKLLNLNIYGGKYYNSILSFVRQNDFDILCFQEVKGGNFGFTKTDIFKSIKDDLGMEGEFVLSTHLIGDKNSYDGNAIFYKKSLLATKKQVAQLYPFSESRLDEIDFRLHPRTVISLDFKVNNRTLSIIDTQLAWSLKAETTPIKEEVGQKLFNFVKQIKNDFILTGDFNLESDTRVVNQFNSLAQNLIEKNGVTNTLNPRTHRAAKSIFPKGLAVDFIFTSSSVKVDEFKLIDAPDLSDHFGLSLTFEV